MKLIICVADENGFSFNNRRLSKDRIVRSRILEIVGKNILHMSPYSKRQFDDSENIIASEDFLNNAAEDDFVFVETKNPSDYMTRISDIYCFRWNRRYPYDGTFVVNQNEFSLCDCMDYEGNSHENITEEHYIRKEIEK